MKDILLKPGTPYFNYVEVEVCDYPGGTGAEPRKRMTITVDYGEFDVNQLKKQGMDFAQVMDYYRDWIYNQVKYRLLDDWKATAGLDETLAIVEEHIKGFFE